jgi:hypothetical protein
MEEPKEPGAWLKISGMNVDGGKSLLRVVSDEKPSADAILATPSLEDVFLLHCGEGEPWLG